MTSAIVSSPAIAPANESAVSRCLTKAEQREELERMGEAMIQEGGLLNVMQSAAFLDRSRERIYELMELKILKRFEFLGRIYLSFDEVKARREADVKGGRPARTFPQKVKATLKAALALDGGQIKRGGTTDYAAKQLAKKKAKAKQKK